MDLTYCPECGLLAEVLERYTLESTGGPVEHAKVLCISGHRFNMPVAMISPPAAYSEDDPLEGR